MSNSSNNNSQNVRFYGVGTSTTSSQTQSSVNVETSSYAQDILEKEFPNLIEIYDRNNVYKNEETERLLQEMAAFIQDLAIAIYPRNTNDWYRIYNMHYNGQYFGSSQNIDPSIILRYLEGKKEEKDEEYGRVNIIYSIALNTFANQALEYYQKALSKNVAEQMNAAATAAAGTAPSFEQPSPSVSTAMQIPRPVIQASSSMPLQQQPQQATSIPSVSSLVSKPSVRSSSLPTVILQQQQRVPFVSSSALLSSSMRQKPVLSKRPRSLYEGLEGQQSFALEQPPAQRRRIEQQQQQQRSLSLSSIQSASAMSDLYKRLILPGVTVPRQAVKPILQKPQQQAQSILALPAPAVQSSALAIVSAPAVQRLVQGISQPLWMPIQLPFIIRPSMNGESAQQQQQQQPSSSEDESKALVLVQQPSGFAQKKVQLVPFQPVRQQPLAQTSSLSSELVPTVHQSKQQVNWKILATDLERNLHDTISVIMQLSFEDVKQTYELLDQTINQQMDLLRQQYPDLSENEILRYIQTLPQEYQRLQYYDMYKKMQDTDAQTIDLYFVYRHYHPDDDVEFRYEVSGPFMNQKQVTDTMTIMEQEVEDRVYEVNRKLYTTWAQDYANNVINLGCLRLTADPNSERLHIILKDFQVTARYERFDDWLMFMGISNHAYELRSTQERQVLRQMFEQVMEQINTEGVMQEYKHVVFSYQWRPDEFESVHFTNWKNALEQWRQSNKLSPVLDHAQLKRIYMRRRSVELVSLINGFMRQLPQVNVPIPVYANVFTCSGNLSKSLTSIVSNDNDNMGVTLLVYRLNPTTDETVNQQIIGAIQSDAFYETVYSLYSISY